jgi:hypothetical protein
MGITDITTALSHAVAALFTLSSIRPARTWRYFVSSILGALNFTEKLIRVGAMVGQSPLTPSLATTGTSGLGWCFRLLRVPLFDAIELATIAVSNDLGLCPSIKIVPIRTILRPDSRWIYS